MTKLRFRYKYKPQWHESELSKHLISAIEQTLTHYLPSVFGFYLLQLGRKEYTHWLNSSPIQQKIVLDPNPVLLTPAPAALIQSPYYQLPFDNNSIDAIFLPCLLETAQHPLAILEEVQRVLLPSGTLILVGFNPWSLWGLSKLLLGKTHEFPWQGQFWSASTVKTWLVKAGFSLDILHYFYFRPPLPPPLWHQKLHCLEKIGTYCYHPCGGLYLMTATKQVAPLSPIKTSWKVLIPDDHLISPNISSRR
ncbi:MAG: methyltransferase domain-containing protein [Gammaproteobacteria bacterium]|nr:methyltransferase domain-containing protein [Gammaproteobacteria bacterium]